jgi:hypothetical protein
MADLLDIQGTISIYRFQIAFGAHTFSANHQQLIVPYTAYGNTTLVADLTTYEYSLDGISWSTMTAAVGTVVTDLDFTPTGEVQTFTWEIKEDIGNNIYNKGVYIRFQATSDDLLTVMTSRSFYFPKIVSNEVNARNANKLPDDYAGIIGSDLLKNAPKTGR